MNKMFDYFAIMGKLPFPIIMDIKGRIQDWICSGGEYSDPYVQNQIQYARRVAKALSYGDSRE